MQVTAGIAGMMPAAGQRRHPAGVNEVQFGQVDDDHGRPVRGRRQRHRDAGGVHQVEFTAQRDGECPGEWRVLKPTLNIAAPSCFGSKARSGPGG